MGDIERQNAPIDYETYRNFFKEHWGHEDFKQDTQRSAIEAIIPNDSDVLVRLPTGEGKSVLFQVPALVRGLKTQRLTIVITPLRALMADQVRSLWGMGFSQSVDYLSGDRDPWVNSEVYQGIIDNRIKLLYIAPERFRLPRFKEALARRLENDGSLEYIVVDEAHCISQWGFEFRPDYLYAISELRRLCRTPDHFSRFLLFSATVTEATRKDIESVTGITAGEYFKIRPEDMPHPIQPFIRLHSEDVQSKLYGNHITSARLGFIEKIIQNTDIYKSAVIIFVTRKRHAKDLCDLLEQSVKSGALQDHARIKYFHAGLPSLERLEIYNEYRERKVNVLICTKAFGMGMDISHIHSCIHLASPAYLEDYLQEVGRTGRGKEDREKAGLASVECNLLYDTDDFETNHTKIMESRITLPELGELWEKLIREARKYAYSNQNLCIIPSEKFDKFDRNTLRLSLFWLERFERIDILDKLYGLLKVRLQKEKLQNFAALGDGDQHRVAKAILQLYESPPSQDSVLEQKGSIVENVLGFVGNILGILFSTGSDSSQRKIAEKKTETTLDIWDEAEIHVANIWQITNLPHTDDIFKALYELQKKGLLAIDRTVEFDNRSFSKDRELLWEWLKLALDRIFVTTPETGRQMSHEDLLTWLTDDVSENSEQNWGEQKVNSARQRVIKSAIALCSTSSFRIYESYDDEGKLTYTYILSKNKISFVRNRVQGILEIAVKIVDRVEVTQRVTFTDLLSCCGERIDFKKLEAALVLLSNLGICANKQELLSQSYILNLRNTTPLDPEDLTERDQEIKDDLEKCNEMARLRSHAMELYAFLPDEYRKKYIDDYFSIGTPSDLMDFLTKTVDAVADENPNLKGDLLELRDSARQNAMKDALDNLSPEEQRPVCELPYQDKFLVNAGPGSGKTRVLIMRCAHLIHYQQIRPNEILVLAFNRAVVHEIRERIIDLFTQLRYGSYVKKLNVYTFHAFAKREMQMNIVNDEDALGILLHSFAEKLRTDVEFRTQVAGRYRAILVDEFQDMNDDFYSVITSLQQGSGAGLMVIGDDDQDILLWERLKKKHGRLHAVDYFETFNRDMANDHIRYLKTNYRSTGEIVGRSQNFLNEVLSTSTTAERLKTQITLVANPENKSSSKIEGKFSLDDFIKIIPEEINENNKVAILCRTNSEVFQTVKKITDSGVIKRSEIVVQNNIQFKLADIRESAEWLDICRKRHSESNKVLTGVLYDELTGDYRNLDLPPNDETLIEQLWEMTQTQYRNPTLQMHMEFIEDLNTSDFERIVKRHKTLPKQGRLIVSTINKVKGLEFDTVFINASHAKFPLSPGMINDSAGEEARLFYVAMTRAKSSLYFQWGGRENAWYKMKAYKGQEGQSYLEGKQEEVFLSWPGYTLQYNNGLQDYITHKVSVGDSVSITDVGIDHKSKVIGKLAHGITKKTWGECTVSAVIRCPVNEKLKQNHPDIYDQIHHDLKQKGWLYTVLVRSA